MAAPGESPVFAGHVKISGHSHWVIEGMTVDPRGLDVGPGIEVRSLAASSVGVVIRNNRVLEVDAPGIKSGISGDMPTNDTLIEGNFVSRATTIGIEVGNGEGVVVRNNVVEGTRCLVAEFVPQHGIVVVSNARGVTIEHNAVYGFEACPDAPPGELRTTGINVRGSPMGTIRSNWLQVTGSGDPAFVGAISVHDQSSGWRVEGNIVVDSEGCGLCDGVDLNTATGTQWTHNTVIRAAVGLQALDSVGATFEHNLVLGTDSAIDIGSLAEGSTTRGNVVWASDNPTGGYWYAGSVFDFEGWRNACGCDDGSVSAEPVLAPDGLTPSAAPALDGAPGSTRGEIAGLAADVGALEAPRLITAAVGTDGISILATFEVATQPLGPQGCEGIEVHRDDVVVGLASCSVEADRIALTLVEPLYAGQAAQLVPFGVTDSADVGGIGAHLSPVAIELDTQHLSEAPDDGGTGHGEGSGDDATATPPPPGGCACSREPSDRVPIAVLGLALFSLVRFFRTSSPTETR